MRAFPMKAQDRAIRAEEGLRYFILTRQPLSRQLTIGQIAALRFAPDEEVGFRLAVAGSKGLVQIWVRIFFILPKAISCTY